MTARLLLLLGLVASPALAQYVVATQAGVSYPALTNPTPIPLLAASGTANDRGRASIPIGFTFPFYNRTYTSLTVTANGVAFLEPSSTANATADFLSNFNIPSVSEPNGVLAPLWDDLDGNNPGSACQSQAVTGVNGQGLAIEWKDWNRHFYTFDLSFQIRLWENGVVEFFYGTMAGTGSLSATVGIESPTGSVGTNAFACGTLCTLASFDPTGLGQPVTYIRFGPPAGIDLQPTQFRVLSISPDGGSDLAVTTELSLRNFGTLPSGQFNYRLVLSSDTVFDVSDVPFTPVTQGPLSLPAYGSTVDTVTSLVPRPDAGTWYVLAFVDDANAITETNETNNILATSVPYAAGVDLVAESIIAPSLAGPGDPVTFSVAFTNQGFDLAGSVPVAVLASLDTIPSPDDRVIGTTTLAVAGGQSVRRDLVFTMPPGIRAGDYYLMLQLDDGPNPGVIPENNENNNVVFSSTRMTVRQADLVVDSVRVLRPTVPYDETGFAFFGEPIRLEAVVRNQGGARALNVTVAFYLSDNETLNGFTDPFVGEVGGLTLLPGDRQVVTFTGNVPTRSIGGQLLRPAAYRFFGAASSPGLSEVNPNNNFIDAPPTLVRDPAPNALPLFVQGPQRLGAGELAVVNRTLANLGNRPMTHVGYRYYLSANTIITTDDVLLPIQTSTGPVDERFVDLAIDQQDVATEVVRIPQGTATASFYLGVLMDPGHLISETDEDDNGLAGQLVNVVAQRLGLATPSLPDAIIGQPYAMDLAGEGAVGPFTYGLQTLSELPAGLTLSSAGHLSGTPTIAGASAFTVLVSAQGRTAEARRTLRVVSSTATLALTTARLPAPARLLPYSIKLGVQGGRAPYLWGVEGQLPAGLTLSSDGVISGIPTGNLGQQGVFTLVVRDAVGNTDARPFTLTVVDATPFQIATVTLPDAVLGADYLTDVLCANGGGAPVSRPVAWTVVGGTLPAGLTLEPSGTERVVLSGKPSVPGLFHVRLEAVDGQGRAAPATFLLVVASSGITVTSTLPTTVARGAQVAAQLTASPSVTGARWFSRDGSLPPGLALAADGTISGTVPDDAPYEVSTLVVGYGTSAADLFTLRSLSVEVAEPSTRKASGCGCTAGDPSALLLGLLPALWALQRRGNRRLRRTPEGSASQ